MIENCYSIGKVNGDGGVVGLASSSSVYDSYWDLNTSGKEDSAFDEGRTTKQLQAGISDALLDEKGIPDPDGDEFFVCRDPENWDFGRSNISQI